MSRTRDSKSLNKSRKERKKRHKILREIVKPAPSHALTSPKESSTTSYRKYFSSAPFLDLCFASFHPDTNPAHFTSKHHHSSGRRLLRRSIHRSLHLRLRHRRASTSQISSRALRILGIIIRDGGLDRILGQHRAMHYSPVSTIRFLKIPLLPPRYRSIDIHFTGGKHNSLAISVFLTLPASSNVIPRTNSVKYELLAIALPQPKVLNFTSLMVLLLGSTLIWSFITSPQAGAPTSPVPTSVSVLFMLPTFRGAE